MHTELKNSKRLKDLYHKALTIKSAIPHPRILGVIRECGGKMHMHERSWSEAATDFFEARAHRPRTRRVRVRSILPILARPCVLARRMPHAQALGMLNWGAACSPMCGGLQRPPGRAGLQELRRGGRRAAHPVPQVPGAGDDAHGERGGPV